jgi:hypothetical protein
MSTRFKNGSHYENHPRAAELHDLAAHTHRVAEQHSDREHLTGHEQTRQALEHTLEPEHSQAHSTIHGVATFGHEDIAMRAHELWQERGCPFGSPDEDWFEAAKELRARAEKNPK